MPKSRKTRKATRKSAKQLRRESQKNQRRQKSINKQTTRPVRRSPQRKSKQTDYDRCRGKVIGTDMAIFKKGKLKSRDGSIVTSRKQAIAIAISTANRKCKDKWTNADYKKGNNRMKKKLKKTNYKHHITIAEVQRAIQQMKRLKSDRKYPKLRQLQRDVMARILMAFPPNEQNKEIPPIILREIQKYIVNDI